MKKRHTIILFLTAPALVFILWLLSEKMLIQNRLHKTCGSSIEGEAWVSCATSVSLEQNDAKYCRGKSIFSPYPTLCMSSFAEKTTNRESCDSIRKPRYKKKCLDRF